MGNGRQVFALLRKNYLIEKRHKGRTLFQLLFPIVIAALLAAGHMGVGLENHAPVDDYPREPIPEYSRAFFIPEEQRLLAMAYAPQSHPGVQRWVEQMKANLPRAEARNRATNGNPLQWSPLDFSDPQVLDSLFIGFDTVEEIDDYVRNNWTTHLWSAVVFSQPQALERSTNSPSQVEYTLRLNSTFVPSASLGLRIKQSKAETILVGTGETTSKEYVGSWFMSAQIATDNAIYHVLNGNTPGTGPMWSVGTKRAPTLSYDTSEFLTVTVNVLPLLLIISLMITTKFLITNMVTEKEKGQRELMAMMGMRNWCYWLSWFMSALVETAPTMFLVSLILKLSLFSRSDFFVVLIFFWLISTNVIVFSFMISAIAKTARVSSNFGMMLFYLMNVPQSISPDNTGAMRTIFSFFVPSSLGWGISDLVKSEVKQTGVKWNNINTGEFPFSTTLLILFLTLWIHILVTWYIDAVMNGGRGWLFCFSSAYWTGKDQGSHGAGDGVQEMSALQNDDVAIEQVPEELRSQRSIEIRGLHKTFPAAVKGGPIVKAVNNLSMDLYRGQVLALLGHNGAGKTTLISILTGLTRLDSGKTFINGHSLTGDIWGVRRQLGVCPQHDKCYDELTIREHFELYGVLKGVPKPELNNAVEKVLENTMLKDIAFMQSNELSGGQRRKLSVGIAYVGDSQVVFLDEPSAGVDAQGRRDIWDIVNMYREDRTTILTSHDMTEADTLGDRVAILSKGKLQCAGTSLFLKNRYGEGYTLTLVMDADEDDVDAANSQVSDLVHEFIPSATLSTQTAGAQLCYVLPLDTVSSFPDLLDALDKEKTELGIKSYGLSVSTLEEVFLNLASREEVDEHVAVPGGTMSAVQPGAGNGNGKAKQHSEHVEKLDRFPNFKQQFAALMSIRLPLANREKAATFQQLFLPVIFIFFGVLAMTFQTNTLDFDKSGDSRVMSMVDYNDVSVPSYLHPAVGTAASSLPPPSLTAVTFAPSTSVSQINDALRPSRDPSSGVVTFAPATCGLVYDAVGNYSVVVAIPPTHVLPSMVNLMSNSFLDADPNTQGFSIQTSSQGMPPAKGDVAQELANIIGGSVLAIYVAMGFAFYPAVIVARITRDRELKIKHQQLISGVTLQVYWMAAFLWDLMLFLVPLLLSVIVMLAFNIDFVKQSGNLGSTVFLLLSYGLAAIPWAYCFSFLFSKHQSAQGITTLVLLMLGMLTVVATMVFMILEVYQGTQPWKMLRNMTTPFFSLLPTYSAGAAVMRTAFRQGVQKAVFGKTPHALGWDYMGMNIMYLWLVALGAWIILFTVEHVVHTKRRKQAVHDATAQLHGKDISQLDEESGLLSGEIDSDVKREQERVHALFNLDGAQSESKAGKNVILVHGLRKVFRPKQGSEPNVAVKGTSFGIKKGEVFGLLGTNGAGKSTTLNMLACDLVPSAGTAILAGNSIAASRRLVFKNIGFCPQYNPLIEHLTCVEAMTFYAKIRGVLPHEIPGHVQQIITILGLEEHKNKLGKDLSGGNQRKLTLGCSMMGTPDILFLDEPSTGLDPKSRRVLWDAIHAYKSGRSIILTTHTMEEADALCSRIGIMVSGELKCLGTSQHLKTKFGHAYEIEISTDSDVQVAKRLHDWMVDQFPDATVTESHHGHHRYAIPLSKISSLADIFAALSEANKDLGAGTVIDYSISQPTLERIFISFAKHETN